MSSKIRKGIALVTAVLVVVTSIFFTNGNVLKAADPGADEATTTVEEQQSEPVEVQGQTKTEEVVVDSSAQEESSASTEEAASDETAASDVDEATDTDEDTDQEMPAQTFSGSANGVSVSASVGEGVFPEGTTMKVTAVSDAKAEAAAEQVVDEVADAKAVDITFYKDGKEIQPEGNVSIKMSLNSALEGEDFVVLHQDGDSVSTIGDASSTGASFSADSFSIYIIVGEGEEATPMVATYKFVDADGNVVDTQEAKTGDKLDEPEAPAVDGQAFQGWYIGEDKVDFSDTVTVTSNETVTVTAKYAEQYFVFFMDDNDIVVQTKTAASGETVDADATFETTSSDKALAGWTTVKGDESKMVTDVTIADSNITLYPIIKTAHWINYDTQGGSVVSSQSYFSTDSTVAPSDPVRTGYTFAGWYTAAEGGTRYTFGSNLNSSITLYAHWTAKTDVAYTVVFWQQKVTDSKNASDSEKTYDYVSSETRTGTVGSTVSPSYSDRNKSYTGFTYNSSKSSTITIAADGTAVLNIYYDRQLMTINWYRYWGISSYLSDTYTGLYGSTLAANGYTWKSGAWRYHKSGSSNWTNLSFLDAFIHPETGEAGTLNLYERTSLSGTGYFYKQNLDGTYPSINNATDTASINGGNNVSFSFTEKYNGFSVVAYSKNGTTWTTTSAGQSVSNYTNLYVRFERNSYTIDYKNTSENGGSTLYTDTLKYEAALSGAEHQSVTPERPSNVPEDYIFTGWYADPACTTLYDFSGTMPANNVAVYAGWSEPPADATYYLSVTASHDEGITLANVKYGDKISLSDLPSISVDSDETFVGWATRTGSEGNYTYTLWNFDNVVTDHVYLYPLVVKTAGYSVSYDLNGGTGNAVTDSKHYAWGSALDVQKIGNVTNGDKTFAGWLTENGQVVYPGEKVEVNEGTYGNDDVVTLTALWNDKTTVSVTYDPNGASGSAVTVDGLKNNSVVANKTQEEVNFTRDGYTFIGWNTDPNATTSIFDGAASVRVDNLEGSNTLYAIWKQQVTITISGNTETTTYDGNAHSVSGITVSGAPEGVTVELKDSVAAEYNVSGTDAGTYSKELSTDDVTITGAENYDITLEVDSTSNANKVVINKRNVTLTSATDSWEYDGKTHKAESVTVGGDGFVSGEGADYTDFASIKNKGVKSNTFEYTLKEGGLLSKETKAENYNITTVYGTLTITDRTAQYDVTIETNSGEYTYDGSAKTVTGFKNLTFEFGDETYTVSGIDASVVATDAGTYPVNVTGNYVVTDSEGTDVTEHFNVTIVAGNLTINKRTVTLTSGSAEKEYDGKALTNGTVTVGGEGFANGEGATYNVTGTQTAVGSSENEFTYALNSNTKADNYTITTANGTLNVTSREAKYEITVVANSDEFTYDGTVKAVNGLQKYKFTVDGNEYTVSGLTAGQSQKDAGTYTVNVTGTAVVKDAEGNDVSSEFTVHTQSGTLKINPRDITLTSATDSKTYDGKALTNDKVTVSGDGFVGSDGASYNVTGTQTAAGTSKNAFEIVWNDGTKESNYNVTKVLGDLTVNKAEVTITVDDAEKQYGTNDPDFTGTVTGLVNEDDLGTITYSRTNDAEAVGTYTDVLTATYEENGNYTVTVVPGTFKITKSDKLTVEAVDYSGVYDAAAHYGGATPSIADGTTIEYSLDNGATWSTTVPSITNVGEVTYQVRATNDSYKTATAEGTLKVTAKTVTVTANDKTKTYGDDDPDFDATVVGTLGDDTVSYDLSREAGEKVGKYTITPAGDEVQGNYKVEYKTGTLTITKAGTLTVNAVTDSQVYNGEALLGGATPSVTEGTTIEYKVGDGEWTTEVPSITNVGSISYQVRATNENYDEATATGTLTVTPAKATITVSNSSKVYGTDDPTFTGSVKGLVNDGDLGTITYSRTNDAEAVGTYTQVLDASYTENDNYTVEVIKGDFEITKAGTLTVEGVDYKGTYDGNAHGDAATASVTEGTTVSYKVGDGEWTTTPPTITNVGKVEVSVKAENSNYETATDTYTLEVTPAEVTITVADSSKVYGTEDPDFAGNVEGLVNEGDLGTITYKRTNNAEDVGTYEEVLTADYTANDNYTVKVVKGDFEITQAGTLTVNAADKSRVYNGEELSTTATASVTEGTTISYKVGEEGEWSTTPPSITDVSQITVYVKAENKNYKTAETTYTLEVTPKTVTVTANDKTKVYGNNDPELTAKVEGTLNGDTVAYDLSRAEGEDVGEYTITPDGDEVQGNYKVEYAAGTLTITKRSVTLTSATDTKIYDGTALTNKTVTPSGDGFAEGEGASYDVTGSQKRVGSSKNTFTYKLNEGTKASNYEIKTVEGTLTVLDRETQYEITVVANSDSVMYDGQKHEVSGFETLSFEVEGNTYTVEGLSASAEGTKAGKYASEVTGTAKVLDADGEDVTNQFLVKTENGELEITKRNVTLTSADGSWEYNGKYHNAESVEVTGDGFAEGEGASYSDFAKIKNVGTKANTFTVTLDTHIFSADTELENYNIKVVNGQLEVTTRDADYEVTVTANSGTFKYDGEKHAVSGFVVEDDVTGYDADTGKITVVVDGETYTITGLKASASGTNVTDSTSVNVEGTAKVTDSEGNDVTSEFAVHTAAGTFDITKRSVTLTSADDSKQYDGKALTNDTVTPSGDGFAEGEGATYDVTGTRTLVGESKNTFTYKLNDGTLADNYDIKTVEGTLKVTDRESKYEITVVANSKTEKYDGTEKSVSGFETLSFEVEGSTYTVEGLSASATGTNAGEYAAEVTGTAVVKDADGTDVTDQFTVNTTDGKLTINKRNVTLTSASDSKEYDGKPLTNKTVTPSVDGFAEGEGATYDVTGTQTRVGKSDNEFTYKLNEGTLEANYNIDKVVGELEVTNRNEQYEITVVANSDSVMYDGNKHEVSGFKTLSFVVDENTYTVEGLSASTDGTKAGKYTSEVTGTAKVLDADGEDVTSQFLVNTENGELEITKRNVTLTSADGSWEYNGKYHNAESVKVTGDGFAEGEGASYSDFAKIKNVGTKANAFTVTLDTHIFSADTELENYNIKVVNGQLEVTTREAAYEVTVTANSGTFKYDGEKHTVSGFETDGNVVTGYDASAGKITVVVDGETYTITGLKASASGTNVTDSTSVNVEGTAKVTDSEGNDVTSEFAVHTKAGKLDITKRSVTLTSATDAKQYDGKALTNKEVTETDDGFAEGEGATYDVTGSRTLVGSSPNTFTYTLNGGTLADNYDIKTVEGTLTVTDRKSKYEVTVVANSDEFKYDGTEKSVSGFEKLSFEVEGNTYTVEGLSASAAGTNAGTYDAKVTGTAVVRDADGADVTRQFTVHTKDGTLTINKRSVTLTSATPEAKEYDGTPLTAKDVQVSGDKFAEGEGATYDVTGSQTIVGSSDNTFTYELKNGTLAANYNIEKVEGKLTVNGRENPFEVTVTANSGGEKYNGSPQTVKGFVVGGNVTAYNDETGDITVIVNGVAYTITGLSAETTKTNAGTYGVEVKGTAEAKVLDANGNNVTEQFKVSTENGSLNIAKRTVKMTSDTASKEYDGKKLTAKNVTETGDGFIEGEGASYSDFSSIRRPGNIENEFEYALNDGTNADNYSITKDYGTLTVTNRNAKYNVTVTANSGGEKYNGEEQTVSGFDVSGNVTGYDEETGIITVVVDDNTYTIEGLSATETQTDAGTYTVNVIGTAKVYDDESKDVTEQFAVAVKNGELKIGQREITLTSATDSKQYDGKPLTNDKVTETGDGFVDGEGIEKYNVTGSQTTVGDSKNTFTYELKDGTNADNYDITVKLGTLTVTDRAEKFAVTIEAKSDTVKYDGNVHTVSGFVKDTIESDGNVYSILSKNKLDIDGVKYEIIGLSAKAEGTNAGTYPVAIEGTAQVFDDEGVDVTDQFDITTVDGTLTIEKRNVILTSASATKTYDGKPLTAKSVKVTGDGFAKDEGLYVEYTYTGSITKVGSSDNTFKYLFTADTNANNYNVQTVFGKLTVTNGPSPVPNGTGGDGGNIVRLTGGDNGVTIIEVPRDQTPIDKRILDKECCILHLIIMLIVLLVSLWYTNSMKRRQKRIFELKEEIADIDITNKLK